MMMTPAALAEKLGIERKPRKNDAGETIPGFALRVPAGCSFAFQQRGSFPKH